MELLGSEKKAGPRPGRGHRGDDLKRLNTAAVMKHIFDHPGLSRSEVAAQLGLSAASVTAIAATLLEAGLLRTMPSSTGGQGRPRVPLQVDNNSSLVMGIHLGPRTTGVVLMGLDGVERASVLVPHPGVDPVASIEKVVVAAQKLLAEHAGGKQVLGTGIATGGIVDRHAAVIIDNPGAGWQNVHVMELLAGRLPGPVIVDNNARAAAQSELLYGHGQQSNDFVLMVITEDLGAVLVNDGRIRAGYSQTAGQIAHLRVSDEQVPCTCGKFGCLAVMASDVVLTKNAIARGLEGVRHSDHVLEMAEAGNEIALEVLAERNRYVGRVASQLIDIHDPELLVIAGTPAETPAVFADLVGEVARSAHGGVHAAGRVVLSSDHVFSLSLFAGSTLVDAVLSDPLGVIGISGAEFDRQTVSH